MAGLVSIDEPVLGVMVGAHMPFGIREEDIIDVYNTFKKACGGKAVGTHICGRIFPLLAKTLLGTELDFISHEFFDSPENIKSYVPKEVKKSGKVLSVGCLSSKKPRLESPDEILEVMRKFRIYGDDFIFTPDCGFRPLIVDGSKEKGYVTSIKKLRNMVVAANKFRSLS